MLTGYRSLPVEFNLNQAIWVLSPTIPATAKAAEQVGPDASMTWWLISMRHVRSTIKFPSRIIPPYARANRYIYQARLAFPVSICFG
jgi:hypothetical protein